MEISCEHPSRGLEAITGASRPSTPTAAVLLGVGASLGMGIALFLASRFVYVYILYNQVIGAAIGSRIRHGYASSRNERSIRDRVSLPLVLLCSLLAYWSFNFCLFIYIWIVQLKATPGLLDLVIGPFAIFWAVAKAQTFFGWHLGLIGNCLVFAVEYLITATVAWQTAHRALEARKESSSASQAVQEDKPAIEQASA